MQNDFNEPKTQAQQVYAYLKDAIYNCKYAPGQEISEKQLFEELPFGRTPIREALLQLQSEELVDIFPRKGMRVATITSELISDLYQTRRLIEPAVAASFCPLYDKIRLLDYQKRLLGAVELSDAGYYALDIEFHSYIVSAANNHMLTGIFTNLMWHQYRMAVFAAMLGRTQRQANDPEHQRILRALLVEDREEIRDAIKAHINTSMVLLMQALC